MADGTQTAATGLALVDISATFWCAWHSTADQGVSEAFERTIEVVDAWSSAPGIGLVAVCCDSPPYLRRQLLETYKQHRAEAPPQAVEQFDRVKARLRERGYLLWSAQGYEADDVIAWAVKQAKADPSISKVVVVSSDKDLCQLVGDKVTCFSPLSRAYMGREAVIDKYGVPPEQIADYLALVGDSSDNIPGVTGVGPKTAAALLASFGSLDIILDAAASEGWELKFSKPKIRAALVEHAAAARLARKVIELRTDMQLDWRELRMEREQAQAEPEEMEGEVMPSEPPPAPMARAEANGNGNSIAIEPSKSTALAPAAPEWTLGLEPHDLATAYRLAQALTKSRLYSRFPTAEAVWAVIIRGREMGMGALEALDSFYVVEGKPYPSAHALIARAMKHPACEYFMLVHSDATSAEYETKRRGHPKPVKHRYSLAEAEQAGVVKGDGNWKKRPAEMARKTAGVQLARIVYPESLGGAYAHEEIQG